MGNSFRWCCCKPSTPKLYEPSDSVVRLGSHERSAFTTYKR